MNFLNFLGKNWLVLNFWEIKFKNTTFQKYFKNKNFPD
jgi:hypothetical protein